MIKDLKCFKRHILFILSITVFVLSSCSGFVSSEESFRQGVKYSQEAKYDEAIVEFNKAIQIKPTSTAYSFRSYVYLLQNKPALAMEDCNKAIEIDSSNTQAYNNRAAAYQKLGNFNQAIIDCNKVIEINPQISFAYKNRALAYFAKKDYAKTWLDVHRAESMSYVFDTDFIKKLKKDSGRKE
jgi:tetratricopeptide (TPR) repeat protein